MNSKLLKVLFLTLSISLTNFGILKISPASGQVTDLFKFCSERKGFNLLGKFDVSWSNTGFPESEFKMISELGFNFVRLPLDYRTFTKAGDWYSFTETEMLKIDKAVQFGIKYGVHVCINFHRAPGYCVNAATLPANQQLNLWTDSLAQKAFVKHWEVFANRYKTVPADQLSFNLVNEPSNVTEAAYVAVMKKAIDAIRAVSPNRVIFIDGLDFGRNMILAFKADPNVALAIHCYDPFGITHYKAEWVNGSADMPMPAWPMLWVSDYLYGPWKSEFKSPLGIQGSFPAGTEIIVNVRQVSTESTLTVKAGTKTILNKKFVCSADPGTDFTKVVKTEWGYQNISNKDFSGTLTEAATKIIFENSSGDWMTINSITLKNGTAINKYTLSDDSWGRKQSTYQIDAAGALKTVDGKDLLPFDNYRKAIADASANRIPLMVQEFGVYNKTPYQVAISFLDDLCQFFRDNKLGWGLWNFNGSFGILNSGRADCPYESYQGYQLDRNMLNVLTKSAVTSVKLTGNPAKGLVFPIPAQDHIYLSASELRGNIKIALADLSGRIVKDQKIEYPESDQFRIDVSALAPGSYVLSATDGKNKFVQKLLICR